MKSFNLNYTDKESLESFVKINNIKNAPNLLVQVFTGVVDKKYIQNLLDNLNSILDESHIIGTTTDGEINSSVVSTHSTVISFSIFDKTVINSKLIQSITSPHQSLDLGEHIAFSLIQKDTKVLISFVTGLDINGEEYLNGIQKISKDCIVSGGLAGDNGEFKTTYVFDNNTIASSGAVAVSLQNIDLKVSTGYSFNWMSIGKELIITKSDKNRVYTIDNISAQDTYRKYLGDEIADGLPAIGVEFPLIIKRGDLNIARAVLNAHKDGSLVFAGNINEGDRVQFGVGNAQMILSESSLKYKEFKSSSVQSIFIYSCMARRRFLQESIANELKPLQSITNVSGFFTYGEFFTNTSCDMKNELLNETMTILALSEGDSQDIEVEYEDTQTKNDDFAKTLSALSNLINVSTKEIDELNATLEIRVEEEVQKNKAKDNLMQRQTRMAQMGEMLSMIAHQWRQPLATIGTITATLEVESSLGILNDTKLLNELQSINNQTQYLSHTISDFRNFFNPNKSKEDIRISNLIDKTLDVIGKTVESKGIKIVKNYSDNQVTVNTYGNEVMQVFLNIIKNATDVFAEKRIDDAKIVIDIKIVDNFCITTFSDNAGGIESDIIDKIFDPYFSTKSEKNGTGLGLYMSKTIIEEHCDGELSVDNVNNGARFNVALLLT